MDRNRRERLRKFVNDLRLERGRQDMQYRGALLVFESDGYSRGFANPRP